MFTKKDLKEFVAAIPLLMLMVASFYGIHTAFKPRDFPLPESVLRAAPKLSPKTEETSGVFRPMMESPTLSVSWWNDADQKVETTVYWLVFLRDADETEFTKTQNDGQRVMVTGNRRKGGKFHYIVVESFKRMD